MITDKKLLRDKLKARRRELTQEQILEKSRIITERLINILEDKRVVMAYLSAFKEVCTDELINHLINGGKTVLVPITDEKNITITPSVLRDLENICRGAYGIREPAEVSKWHGKIDAAVIPGIGFDKNGGRIGFGMGYYDRFLEKFDGLKIGICYDFQLVEKIEAEKTDISMDMIVTERDCYVI